MKFRIIANEQTPKVESTLFVQDFFIEGSELFTGDSEMLEKYISFSSRQHNCAGLAANQVSLDGIRIMERFFAIKKNRFWDIILDPRILKYTGKKEIKEEGCLTWIGKKFEVYRYPSIDVNYYDIKGNFIEDTIKGFEAQVFQHEVDHLNGINENIPN